MTNLDDVKARLAAYEATRGYDILDYPARVAGIQASKEMKAHAPADLAYLLKRVEALETALRAIRDLPEHIRAEVAFRRIEDIARRALDGD